MSLSIFVLNIVSIIVGLFFMVVFSLCIGSIIVYSGLGRDGYAHRNDLTRDYWQKEIKYFKVLQWFIFFPHVWYEETGDLGHPMGNIEFFHPKFFDFIMGTIGKWTFRILLIIILSIILWAIFVTLWYDPLVLS